MQKNVWLLIQGSCVLKTKIYCRLCIPNSRVKHRYKMDKTAKANKGNKVKIRVNFGIETHFMVMILVY